LGAIAAAGHSNVTVARRPRVAIVPTGTELVPVGSQPAPGQILEYNSIVMAAQVKAMGGDSTRSPIVVDDLDLIVQTVREAARDHDLVLLNAGSSAGSEDFSARVVERLGTVLVHGVAVRPGHPVILGMMHASPQAASPVRPIIGVPGYPVSAALTMDIFVEPLLARWLGRSPLRPSTETAEISHKLVSAGGDEDHVRVALGRVGEKLVAAPLSRGAGVITSLVQADGVVVVPSGVQGIEAGERVEVQLYRGKAELERTILCVGSHDLTLDLLSEFLAQQDRRLVSANVGSQGGLIALRHQHAHLAGSHLLDPQTGEYNISYVRQYMPGVAVTVVALVGREQGLIVHPANPKRIEALEDLVRPDVLFMNRQRGAGTRVLLDYHLGLRGIAPEKIRGYNQQEYTHLGVAAAVASGRADCGLGIAAAAQALSLLFIPLFKERYDLVIPREYADKELLAPLWTMLERRDFREAVSKLHGYDVSVMGKRILEDG
jgi:putative molybdopterin biosynthesis protein